MPEEQNDIQPVKFEDNQFFDQKTGKLVLPSLMTKAQEEDFKIYPSWFVDDNSFSDSIRRIRNYDNADQYRSVYLTLSQSDIYYLKFIADFKSVQKLHLIRQAKLYPDLFDVSKVSSSIRHLFLNNLIWKWTYDHPIYGEKIQVYTLSSNGYYFLKSLFGREHYFYPMLFLSPRIPDVFHVRFWETVDLYQMLSSLPIYRGSTTLFNGTDEKKLMNSPLQVSLMLNGNTQRLVFYPTLQNDGDKYYQTVISKWSDFTDDGSELTRGVNGLPGKQNILTFYSSTLQYAKEFAKKFQLSQRKFPTLFVVGSMIKSYGVQSSFFAPILDDKENNIKQVQFKRIFDD